MSWRTWRPDAVPYDHEEIPSVSSSLEPYPTSLLPKSSLERANAGANDHNHSVSSHWKRGCAVNLKTLTTPLFYPYVYVIMLLSIVPCEAAEAAEEASPFLKRRLLLKVIYTYTPYTTTTTLPDQQKYIFDIIFIPFHDQHSQCSMNVLNVWKWFLGEILLPYQCWPHVSIYFIL